MGGAGMLAATTDEDPKECARGTQRARVGASYLRVTMQNRRSIGGNPSRS